MPHATVVQVLVESHVQSLLPWRPSTLQRCTGSYESTILDVNRVIGSMLYYIGMVDIGLCYYKNGYFFHNKKKVPAADYIFHIYRNYLNSYTT